MAGNPLSSRSEFGGQSSDGRKTISEIPMGLFHLAPKPWLDMAVLPDGSCDELLRLLSGGLLVEVDATVVAAVVAVDPLLVLLVGVTVVRVKTRASWMITLPTLA